MVATEATRLGSMIGPDFLRHQGRGHGSALLKLTETESSMAIKKSELYSSLWASCDELRGGMDASQYKDYVLVLLFIKYVSDKYADQPYAPITIPPGASFKDMVALKGTSDIGDQINKKIIAPLANANKLSDFPDFNDAAKLGSGKEMVDRLTNLIASSGRRKGTPNKATVEIRQLARDLVDDAAYRDALRTRLINGTAGAMEPMLWAYAYGKPKDTVKHEGDKTLIVRFGGVYKPDGTKTA